MAINPLNPDHTARLQNALRYSWEQQSCERDQRRLLRDFYRGFDRNSTLRTDEDRPLVNLFVQYATGHLLSVSHQLPKYSVNSRTLQGRGFDKRIANFLNRYVQALSLGRVFRQAALDSVFGRAVIKVVDGPAPLGVYSDYAPRAYRINPDFLIVEQGADDIEEASFIGDVYLMPLSEAQNEPVYDPAVAATLEPWNDITDADPTPGHRVSDVYAEDMTRLIDVYCPATRELVTWPAPSDTFGDVATSPPLNVRRLPDSPYCVLDLLTLPDSVEDFSRLETLSPLNALANDLLKKAARQARMSKRNPMAKQGVEQDLDTVVSAPDNEGVLAQEPDLIGLYSIPGPDESLVNLGAQSLRMFSQFGGNLSVALGQSTGASTARQTQALIGQISNEQSMDRTQFEIFMAEVGKKLVTLAFPNESLELEVAEKVPGTQFAYNAGWAPPSQLPRPGGVTDFSFEVVPMSASFRSPEERLGQLQQAAQLVMQWMMAKGQGAPINVEAIMEDASQAFDLVPRLQEWFSGGDPTPREKAQQTYQSVMPHQPGGANVNYVSGFGGGPPGVEGAPEPSPGGLQGFK